MDAPNGRAISKLIWLILTVLIAAVGTLVGRWAVHIDNTLEALQRTDTALQVNMADLAAKQNQLLANGEVLRLWLYRQPPPTPSS